MTQAMTQVNVRMSSALKQAGDSAFATAGLSPSDVVRAVYRRAAELAHTLHGLSDIVTSDAPSEEDQDIRTQKLAAFDQSGRAFDDAARHYGIQIDPCSFKPMTEEEVEEAFYHDYLAEGVQ